MLDHNAAMSCKYWKDTFSSKFLNFCKKSPVLLSVDIRVQDGEEGVLVTHVNSNSKYFFPFVYETPVKDFIAHIKNVLVERHYPRIVEEILEKHELTPEEIVIKIEKGAEIDNLSKYEMRSTGSRIYRIDKILAWKQIAILVLESSTFENDAIGTSYRYKFNGGSLVIFLKRYRSGKFKSIEEASNHFLSKSLLIDTIRTAEQKNEPSNQSKTREKTEDSEDSEDPEQIEKQETQEEAI